MPVNLSRRAVGATLAAVLAAALVGAGIGWAVAASSGCSGGPTDRALSPDPPGGTAYPEVADIAKDYETAVTGYLAAVGVNVVPRWGLWEDLPEVRDGETVEREPSVPAVAVAGDTVVTVQRFGSGSGDTVLAGYDARTGVMRWQVDGPTLRGTPSLLPGAPGRLLLFEPGDGAGVTALDPATGAVAWCTGAGSADATATVVTAGPERVVLSSQNGSDSTLRALDPTSGDELWRVEFEAHDSTVAPALAGDVVLVYAVPDGEGDSELRAFDVATGALRWTVVPAAPPNDLAGGAATAVVTTNDGDAPRIDAFDPRTGAPTWTAGVRTSGPAGLHVLDDGVLVAVDRGSQPGDLLLLDPATGNTRWTAAGVGGDIRYGPIPYVLDDPARLLVGEHEQLAVVDIASGGVTAIRTDGESVLAAGPTGEVIVTRSGQRVSVLTAGP